MKDEKKTTDTIEDYLKSFPPEVQKKLRTLRELIRAEAPEAAEKMSYGMPTFYLNGNLVHFAAYAKHIGFYPTPTGIEAFKTELSAYKSSKGAVQFPVEDPLPVELIKNIVRFRVGENRKSGK